MSQRHDVVNVFLEENVLEDVINTLIEEKPELAITYKCLDSLNRCVGLIPARDEVVCDGLHEDSASVLEEGRQGLEKSMGSFVEGIISAYLLDWERYLQTSHGLRDAYNILENFVVEALERHT